MSDSPKSDEPQTDEPAPDARDEEEASAAVDDEEHEHKEAEPTPDARRGGMGTLIGVLGFVAALGGGFFIGQWWNNRSAASNVEVAEGPRYKIALRGDEPQIGPDDALVTVIEFADYECPYCVRAAGPVEQAVKKDSDTRLIYMHYPLPGHPKAQPASQAAWAAHQQGKFWELHAWLFEQKGELTGLEQKVKSLGLDWGRFQKDMLSNEARESIDADFLAGGKGGVTGTPTFFVNGRRYVGSKSVADWKKIIKAEKKEAERMVAAGTPRAQLFAKMMEDAIEGSVERKRTAPQRRPGEPDPDAVYRVPADGRPSLGPDDALVTIVQFSDFECAFCEKIAPTVKALVERHDDVRVVFRNLPLAMHKNAPQAAKAALAAHQQGKFWEMHDALFAHRKRLGDAPWNEFAEEIGLDVSRFEADLQDPALEAMIEEDMAIAGQYNVRGTPAAFINGRFISGALPAEAFDRVISEARDQAVAIVESGTPASAVYGAIMQSAQTEVVDP
jgi:protein-disulfide isomerase